MEGIVSIKSLDYKELEKVADALKVIAHPVRISILGLLENGEKMTVTEIHNALDLDQAPVSHHLGLLRNKGILDAMREGKNIYYAVNQPNLKGIMCCFKRCADS